MFNIDEKLAQAILQYLATRPYAEVFQLIGGIQQLKRVEVAKEVKEEKKK